MATRIAWLLNLDADAELADPVRYRDTALPAPRVRELMSSMLDLVADDDVILESSLPNTSAPSFDVALAFCPTPSAIARIAALGLTPPDAPSFDVLRTVNDRRFCAQLGHGLPGAAFVDDMNALEQCLRVPSPTGSHGIKRAFSFAGRDQRRVHDGVLDASTRGFCERSFRLGEGVQVEPWMQRTLDCSKHGYVLRDARVLVGLTRGQLIDPMGRYIGMLEGITLSDAEETSLDKEIIRVGHALHAAGYFGPFGIDAFRYLLPDGTTAFNPRCEINARFTMGYPRALLTEALKALVA